MAASLTGTRRTRQRKPIFGRSRATRAQPTRTGFSSPPVAPDQANYAARLRRAGGVAILVALIISLTRDSGPRRFAVRPVSFDRLSGWNDDRVAAAIPAFVKSCARFL